MDRFAHHVATGLNQSAAYRAAYDAENMSPRSVWTEGSRLAANPKVAQRVRSIEAEIEVVTKYERGQAARFVLNELHSLASKAGSEKARLRALELLGRHLRLFGDG